MNHMDINKRKKYIVGSATAMAVAIASCGIGAYGDRNIELENSSIYMADNVESVTTTVATTTDAELDLTETIASGINVEEKDVYKDETVYVFADANGSTDSILVNEKLKNTDGAATLSDKTDLQDIVNVKGDETYTQDGDTITWEAGGKDICYQGTTDKALPVDVKVTYYLDGREITPEQLAGQSGNVKIRFDYTNNETVEKDINGKQETIAVPFVVVSGMILGDNFTNITVENGKTMAEGDSNIVIGYAMPGMQDSLGVKDDELTEDISFPDYFEVTADVTDFSVDMTVTLVMNGSAMNLAGDIDMSSMDDLVDSLTDASEQLVDGAGQLSDGVNTLLAKMGDFSSGVSQLQSGLNSLANGSGTLASGINTINASAQSICSGVGALDTALNTAMTDEEKQATAEQASEAAVAAVQAQFDAGQYAAISEQAANAYATVMNSQDTINMIYNGLNGNTELKNALFATGVLPAYQTAAAQNPGLTYEAYVIGLDETTKTYIWGQVDGNLRTMATQIAAGIASNGATTIGNQMADACKNAAETAAGQAAGQAVVAGAEGAKAQISAQINAVQDSGYSLVTGTQALAAGTSALASGVPTLTDGVSQLIAGMSTLANGTSLLSDGVSQLADGATALDDGMNQFNQEAILKLANAYNGDVKKLAARIQAVLEASTEYDTFTMLNEGDTGTTKFIIKTEGISAK